MSRIFQLVDVNLVERAKPSLRAVFLYSFWAYRSASDTCLSGNLKVLRTEMVIPVARKTGETFESVILKVPLVLKL